MRNLKFMQAPMENLSYLGGIRDCSLDSQPPLRHACNIEIGVVTITTAQKGMQKRVLIVDDEVDITDSLKTGLTSKGFSVDAYNDPIAALAHFKSNQFDVVILDIRMPNMTGFDLYREMIKLDGKTNYCFFTAFDIHHSEFEKVFPDVNVRAFLKKPISPSQMVERLNLVMTQNAT